MPSVKELLNLSSRDVAKMSRQELARTVSQLASAGNKRLRRLERTPMGTESRPYKSAMEVGNFSVAGKNQGQLQNEFKRVREFLTAETSTVQGWKKYRASVKKRIGGEFSSEEAEKAYWKAYREIAKSERALHHSYGSEETQRLLHSEQAKSKPLSKQEKELYRKLFPEDKRSFRGLKQLDIAVIRTLIEMEENYETQEQQEQGRYGGNSGFFKIGGSDT